MGRSDVARKQNANFLVSIHADAAPKPVVPPVPLYGCSQTVAPTAKWPAGWNSMRSSRSCWAGRVMCFGEQSGRPYLSQAVLDLQFGHSQRVGGMM